MQIMEDINSPQYRDKMSSFARQEYNHGIDDALAFLTREGKLSSGYDYAIVDAAGRLIAETYEHVGYKDARSFEKRPARSNARLIAAAPDLLNALLNLLDEYSSSGLHGRAGLEACKAIALAKGEL